MIAKHIVLILLITVPSCLAANVRQGTRSLGLLQDILLETIDELTRPDEEEDVDENIITDPPTSIPSTEPMIDVITLVPTGSEITIESDVPSTIASDVPSSAPSDIISDAPSIVPIFLSSNVPSNVPSSIPVSVQSDLPSINIGVDNGVTTAPTNMPSSSPSDMPSLAPSDMPSLSPSKIPSLAPSSIPSDVPSTIPSDGPSETPTTTPSLLPSTTPTTSPSDSPSFLPSVVPSDSPSGIPSDIPSIAPSSVPSDVPSSFPSSVPSEVISSLPTGMLSFSPSGSPTVPSLIVPPTNSPKILNEEDVALFESTCVQFLYDYLPLVQPNDYSNLACTLVNQTKAETRVRRRMVEEAVVPFQINDIVMSVAVTGDAPGEANFARVVSQTFETFGAELQETLRQSSDIFEEDEVDVVSPIPEKEPVTQAAKNGSSIDWTILGSAIAGGICLALFVSLLLVRTSRYRRSTTTTVPAEANLSDVQSKSFSVSSVRDGSSFRDYNLIKLISIEASRSLQKNDDANDDDDKEANIPPTPLGIDAVPDTLMNSPEEIKSELSPSSNYGDGFGCCNQALENIDTFDGPTLAAVSTQNPNGQSTLQDYVDGHTTMATGLSTVMMTYQESGTNRDQVSSSQSDVSELEGLRLVVSTTNTFSNYEPGLGTEPQEKQVQTPTRRFFHLRPSSFLHRRTAASNNVSNDGSMADSGDCCATDNWTVRTNSIVTPRKANTTSGNSMTGRSTSF